ncbi:hypothetical protein [Algirhabdus cladophorae]|uniref:hypothetical protein n=1 Tax=Algirhabdus cladophorae TaxID=3377108 RepID=UPI003B845C2A
MQAASLVPDTAVSPHRTALVPASAPAGGGVRGQSLFIGQEGASLFAPYPERPMTKRGRSLPLDGGQLARPGGGPLGGGAYSPLERLRALIQKAESRRDGYDAVQYGATRRPAKRPTDMSLGEIFQWIEATPGQPHAIGRYQFIPKTLRRLVKRLNLPAHIRFSPGVQDDLADVLLAEAGLQALDRSEISRETFMHNLAKIWAGLPLPNGKSYYEGYAGNKASITWAYFEAEMVAIFPG